MINMGIAESGLRHWVVSEKDAVGPWQIRPADWMHLLWYVNEGKLARVVDLNKKTYAEKVEYFKYIPYNFEMACMIIKDALKRYDGNYELALLAYLYGDSEHNTSFNWRKANMHVWRNEEHYKKVFRPFPWWLFLPGFIIVTPLTID